MNIEGVAEIELTNVHTGEKERYVEKNMVTNALQYIANARVNGMALIDSIAPLYGGGLGGILIFSENIEENPDIVVPPGNIECIGYAGTEAYAGKDERRGSKNITETQRLDDGAKLVWDFATNQANGTIKCLSLTSGIGGNCGLGSEGGVDYTHTHMIKYGTSGAISGGKYDMEYDWIASKTNNVITIKRYKRPNTKIMITCDYARRGIAESFTMDVSDNTSISIEFQQDVNNLYFIGVKAIGNDTNVDIRIFNKNTQQVTKKTVLVAGIKLSGWYPLLKTPYIYMWSGSVMYKINLENPTDVVKINTLAESSYHEYSIIGNRIYTPRSIVDENDKALKFKSTNFSYNERNCAYYQADQTGLVYITTYGVGNSHDYYLYSAYLATINNLATPVIKTADKTMKITYTIREKLE